MDTLQIRDGMRPRRDIFTPDAGGARKLLSRFDDDRKAVMAGRIALAGGSRAKTRAHRVLDQAR
jgi:hypothetical protein